MEWIKKPTPTILHLVECVIVANRKDWTLAILDRHDKGETSAQFAARLEYAIAKTAQKVFLPARTTCQ
ncbi:MAG: hypothetical protein P8Z30_03405 [Acidobacteriota bacterium]